jgi:hypothetical protein
MGYASPAGPQQSQGLAIGALVCGIISIVSVCVWFLSIPLGIVAVILGIVGKGKAQRGEAGGQGLAKAGLTLGAIGVVLSLVLHIAFIAGVSFLGSKAEQLQKEMEQKAKEMEQQQQVDHTESSSPTTAP